MLHDMSLDISYQFPTKEDEQFSCQSRIQDKQSSSIFLKSQAFKKKKI